jgi:aryl-alcohol dehydrogenase-like predicted oxidoreductase
MIDVTTILNCIMTNKGDAMFSVEMGRRNFIRKISSAVLGVWTSGLWNARSSLAKTENMPALEYHILGKTGLKVTAVGMGVMNCSDSAVVLRAFDLGINFYDTAPSYMGGRNEEMVGKTLKGKRDKVFIQTKLHFGDEKKMRDSVERSLRRLQTDYIDVLLWHGLGAADEVSDSRLFEFMEKMKKEGKARFTGFSAHSRMALLLREATKTNYHDVALVSYNFTHSKELGDAVAQAARSGMGVVAMKTQAGGYKKGKMGNLSPHQAALKYVLRDTNVTLAVPGVTTIEQIEECAAVMGTTLSQRDVGRLRQYHSFLQGRICTMCGGCGGECPYGVPYGQFLRAMMYHDGYEDDRLAVDALGSMRASQIAERCSGCPSCSVVCRRGLNIQAQIRQAQHIL